VFAYFPEIIRREQKFLEKLQHEQMLSPEIAEKFAE
jgi:hypothetical protein